MSSYITAAEFAASSYGIDFVPGTDSIFATSGAIQTFLDYISDLIDLYAGNSFGTGAITEQFVAKPGQSKVYLRKMPLNSIASISYYQPGYVTPTLVTDTTSYKFFSDGRVIFNNTLYGNAVYEFVYNAGYTTIPSQIKLATLILANTYALAIENSAVGTPGGGDTTRFVFGKYEENYVDPRQRYDLPEVGIPITVHSIIQRFKYLK